MPNVNALHAILVVLVLGSVEIHADYNCLCNYNVEKQVLPSADSSATPMGYLYEFDCKNVVPIKGLNSQFKAIEYQHKLGYVEIGNGIQTQMCPGDPPATDTIPATTTAPPSTTGATSTSTKTITSTQKPISSTTTTLSTTLVPKLSTVTTTHMVPTTTTPSTTHMPSTSTPKPTVETTTSISVPTTTLPSTARMPTTTTPKPTVATTTTTSTTLKHTTNMPTSSSTLPSISSSTKIIVTSKPVQSYSSTSPLPTQTSVPVTTATIALTTAMSHNVNTTGTPLAYVGIGYNLLTGNPGGMNANIYGVDPGLLLSRRILQLTATNRSSDMAMEAEYGFHHPFNYGNHRYIVHDGKSYQNELLQNVDLSNSYNQSETLKAEAFTLNNEFMLVRHNTEDGGSAVYNDVVTLSVVGNVRYKEELVNTSNFMISREFASDVCQLPQSYNASDYLTFIDKWGTNIVMAADIGTVSVTRYTTSAQQVLQHVQGQANNIVYPTGAYKGYQSSLTLNSTLLSKLHLTPFGSLISNNQMGQMTSPVPVGLTLNPITSALDVKYWSQVLNAQSFMDVCPDSTDEAFLQIITSNMDLALEEYAAYKQTAAQSHPFKPLTDIPLTVPITWPYGTYGLMQATSGCPGSRVAWQHGYRKYDTEDTSSNSYFSSNIAHYLAGSFAKSDIITNFCMKTQASTDVQYNHDWPSGTYCILQKGHCPSGFGSGYIYWDDDDFNNHNSAGGVLPDGEYNKNTKIYYCCRHDGSASREIHLPRDRAFVLVRYGPTCQSVHDMNVHEVFVRWDDEDLFNKDSAGGQHPLDDGGSKDHKLHFCHYSERQTGVMPGIVG